MPTNHSRAKPYRHPSLSKKEIAEYKTQFRALSNSGKYTTAHVLAKSLVKKHPDILYFQYIEAVMTAEQSAGYSKKQIEKRYRLASAKLKKLIPKTRSAKNKKMHSSIMNEYYWFSKQPLKQYRLGVAQVKEGDKYAYYSQGVGAAMMALHLSELNKKSSALRWAKKSEQAWLNYFKIVPDWYNSYLFFAMALGFQNKIAEMDSAFKTASKISRQPLTHPVFNEFRKHIKTFHKNFPK